MTDATSTKKLTLSGEIDQDGLGGWIEDNVLSLAAAGAIYLGMINRASS